ncbi:MAG: hypothetical protein PHD61_06935 [Bacteroidales bacterium]|nr:hypothetical protein [Lentimicrobiaceae bacterium]MDD5695023.1 hypothetical protein [Bacteroidales bacterium]
MYKLKFIMGIFLLAGLLFVAGCKDDEEETVVTITTSAVSDVTANGAMSGGTIAVTGEVDVTARGVCWSTVNDPTTADPKTTDGTGTGSYTSTITGLTANTPYYVRAYCVNAGVTYYGTSINFTTEPPEPVELIVNGDFALPGVNGELITATPWKTDETTDADANGQLDYIGYAFDDYKGHTGYVWCWDWSEGFYQTVGTVPTTETNYDISFSNTCTWNAWGDYKPITVFIFSAYSGADPTTRVAIDSVEFEETDFFPGWDLNTWLAKNGTYTLSAAKAAAFAGQNLVIEIDVIAGNYDPWFSDVWYNIDDVSVIQH